VKKTRNLEIIINSLIKYGFSHRYPYVRNRSVNLAPDIIEAERGIFSSRSGLNEVRKLIERVILALSDNNNAVREEAKEILIKIK